MNSPHAEEQNVSCVDEAGAYGIIISPSLSPAFFSNSKELGEEK